MFKNIKCFLAFIVALSAFARPLPAEIIIRTEPYQNQTLNPAPSAANMALLRQAIDLLVNNPLLVNHPIRRYFNDPSLHAEISFDNPRIRPEIQASTTIYNSRVNIKSNADLAYYLENIAHEFIHIDVSEKYFKDFNYSFLNPEDYAFRYLMEEAFANTLNIWMRLNYPQEMNSDMQIRNWTQQNNNYKIADAMRNDLRWQNPGWSDQQINNDVIKYMFNLFMLNRNAYALDIIPRNMSLDYEFGNTFLIDEYAAYRERGDAFLRHQFKYLESIVPFILPLEMDYDYFRDKFKKHYDWLALFAEDPEDSILYWINYDAEGAARAKLAALPPAERRYDFLSLENEQRLNRIFQEIDPYFVPVDTELSFQRLLQLRYEMEAKSRR